jgi:hypothetical protein
MKDLAEKILDSIGIINNEFRAQKILEEAQREDRKKALIELTEEEDLTDYSIEYELDKNGNRLGYCCGAMLDPDSDRCPTCLEYC